MVTIVSADKSNRFNAALVKAAGFNLTRDTLAQGPERTHTATNTHTQNHSEKICKSNAHACVVGIFLTWSALQCFLMCYFFHKYNVEFLVIGRCSTVFVNTLQFIIFIVRSNKIRTDMTALFLLLRGQRRKNCCSLLFGIVYK